LTEIDKANPTSTAGGASTTRYVDASPVRKTLLKFDLTPLVGKTKLIVKLMFKTMSSTSAGLINSSDVKLVGDALWKEQYLSYSNPVVISSTLLGTVPFNSAPNTWYEIMLEPFAIQQNLGGLLTVRGDRIDGRG